MSTAIVIGATGLVGRCLVQQLLSDPDYSSVVALTRRATAVRDDKYHEHVVDFARPEAFADWVKGDVLFSAMGTTRRQAGSIAAQRTVDYTYQFEVAQAALQNGVKAYVLVSSRGANPSSLAAYMKMKGELERDVQGLGFSSLQILRPGPLTGEREQPRLGEAVAETVLGAFNAVGLLRSMRPISGDQVARAMRHAATLSGSRTHGPAELFTLAE
jgi:uncharacterized protein YbjT (DUF2867 family)